MPKPLRVVPTDLHHSALTVDFHADPDPTGIARLGVDGHADYARSDNNNQLRMSGYNLAAVLADLPNNEVKQAPPVQVDLPIGAQSK